MKKMLTMFVVTLVPAAALAAPNELTAEEAKAGYESLFDGESLEHWRGFKLDQVPAGWAVADGVIHFAPPTGDGAGPRADLITREQYRSFEFRFDWAVTPGGNSGVMFHVSEDARASYSTGPEFQNPGRRRAPGRSAHGNLGSLELRPPRPAGRRTGTRG